MARSLIHQDQVGQSGTYSDKELEEIKEKNIKKKELTKPKEEVK